jgi:hypothetical protein
MMFTRRFRVKSAEALSLVAVLPPARAIVVAALVVSTATALAQDVSSDAASYCADLKRVAALALAGDRFASIAGKPREGNFRDTTLPLTGWKDCSLYGAGMYTCDSQELTTAEEAEKTQARIVDQILSCFAGTWLEIKDRSSPSYAVLHPTRGSASITLSLDENDKKEHVVRLILFLRTP